MNRALSGGLRRGTRHLRPCARREREEAGGFHQGIHHGAPALPADSPAGFKVCVCAT